MKKIVVSVVFLLFVSSIVAQKKTVLLNTGLSMPVSTEYFSDYWSASYNFGGGLEMSLNPQLSVLAYIDYNNFTFDVQKAKDKLETTNTGDGGDANALNLSVNLKYYLNDSTQKILPYILGGLGYTNFSFSDLVVRRANGVYSYTISGESIGALSLNLGFGAQFLVLPNISIFVDARYILGFTDGDDLNFTISDNDEEEAVPYSLNDNTNYIPLRVGVSYSF